MNLIVKIIDAPGLIGGKGLALCDERGLMLPMQQACEVSCGIDGPSTITARFLIDGEAIRFAD